MIPPRSATHQALLAEVDRVLASGSSGLVALPPEVNFVARRGSGARLWDVDGREFLDLYLGYGPLILGHAHPAVVEAVQRQAAEGAHFYLLSEESLALAGLLADMKDEPRQVRFLSSGSEATYYALRLARAATGRRKLLFFAGAFHGTHDYAYPTGNGVPKALREDILVAPFNDLEATGRLIAEHAGQLAAVMLEPMQRCIPPAPGFLIGLRELTQQHDALLIADEVITGFRLAYGGAQERYGFEADLTCFGKIVGGGYPLAAIVGRRELMQHLDVRQPRRPGYTLVGGTLSNNPLCAAAGLATLELLRREDPYSRLRALGARLRSGLEEIGSRRGLPLRTIGDDTVFATVFAAEAPRNGAQLARVDYDLMTRFCAGMIQRGVLLFRTVFMSTAHTEADVERALEAADASAGDL